MRVFRWLLLLLGLALLGIDLYFMQHGKTLCPYEGCKVVSSTPFAVLRGYPLSVWGIFFFASAFIFSWLEELLSVWVALGMGFSLYMVYLQFFVINRLCQMCLLIEAIVCLLFFTLLSGRRFLYMLLLIVIGFLGTHALYTFPPDYADPKVAEAAVWKGSGEYTVAFFFDPLCPACGKSFRLMKENRKVFKEVRFKSLAIHDGSFKRARAFYDMCYSGRDPWDAFELVHRKEFSHEKYKVSYAKVKGIVKRNLDAIIAMGIDAVPVLVVYDSKSICKVLIGYSSIKAWLEEVTYSEPQGSGIPLLHPLEGELCTPTKECN